MRELAEALRRAGVSRVDTDVSLAEHTTYRVGGPAALLIRPESAAEVVTAVRLLGDAQVPWSAVGWGSNLIVADEGFPGAVIKLGEGLRYVKLPRAWSEDAGEVQVLVGAATMNNHLVRRLHSAELSGAEFLALVPGTFGGAVAMNAGTRSGEIASIVVEVTVVMGDAHIRRLSHAELNFRYRYAEVPDGAIIVEGAIRAHTGGAAAGRAAVRREREYRNETQPYNRPSAGSVFTNPPGDHAGRLIEAAGLKGLRIGGAHVSTLHANFIVTEPGARAFDVVQLMARARARVREQFGVVLEPEQRLLGFGRGSAALLDEIARDPAFEPPEVTQ